MRKVVIQVVSSTPGRRWKPTFECLRSSTGCSVIGETGSRMQRAAYIYIIHEEEEGQICNVLVVHHRRSLFPDVRGAKQNSSPVVLLEVQELKAAF